MSQNVQLEIRALSINLWVKIIEFEFTPKVFSAGGFLHKGSHILELLLFLIE